MRLLVLARAHVAQGRVDDCSRLYSAADVPRPSSKSVVLVSARRMAEVERVACDDEVVWPAEQAGIEGEIDRLERMVEELG